MLCVWLSSPRASRPDFRLSVRHSQHTTLREFSSKEHIECLLFFKISCSFWVLCLGQQSHNPGKKLDSVSLLHPSLTDSQAPMSPELNPLPRTSSAILETRNHLGLAESYQVSLSFFLCSAGLPTPGYSPHCGHSICSVRRYGLDPISFHRSPLLT